MQEMTFCFNPEMNTFPVRFGHSWKSRKLWYSFPATMESYADILISHLDIIKPQDDCNHNFLIYLVFTL